MVPDGQSSVKASQRTTLFRISRKRGASQIVLAGMAANLCLQSHLRNLLEEGFEVAVVCDATAAPRIAAADAYFAAVTNYRFLAHAVWMTDDAVSHMREAA